MAGSATYVYRRLEEFVKNAGMFDGERHLHLFLYFFICLVEVKKRK